MDHDLHTLLMAARDDAPPPRHSVDDITAAGRQLVRRRRRLTLLSTVAGGAVAAVTSVTAALVLLAPNVTGPAVNPSGPPGGVESSPARPTTFTDAPAFTTNYAGYSAGGYTVSDPELVTASYQQSSITLTQPEPQASQLPKELEDKMRSSVQGRLIVYRSGAFNPRLFTVGEKVDVQGRIAWLRYAARPSMPPTGADKTRPADAVPTLAWQYTEGNWAVIYWNDFLDPPTEDALLALAEGLRPAETRAFPVAFRVKELPRSYQLLSVSYRSDAYAVQDRSVVRLTMKPPAGPLVEPIDLDGYPTLTLTLGVADRYQGAPGAKPSCVSDVPVCTVLIDNGNHFVQAEANGIQVPVSELSKLVLGIAPEPRLDDASDWPAAAVVFP